MIKKLFIILITVLVLCFNVYAKEVIYNGYASFDKEKIAILNNQLYNIGDTFRDLIIIDITPKYVLLRAPELQDNKAQMTIIWFNRNKEESN